MTQQHTSLRNKLGSLAAITIAVCTLSAQTATVIDVTDSRPLWRALDSLEKMVGMPINYEDPPYENAADVQDVSTWTQRAANPGYHNWVPRIGRVRAEFEPPPIGAASANDGMVLVNLLLSSYRKSSLPGDFTVEQANSMTYITPTKILSADGSSLAVTSPMGTLVNVPFAERRVDDTVQAILDSVNQATGLQIVVGSLPFWPTDLVSFGVTGMSARDALASLFAQTGRGPLSYRLVFDPKPDTMRVFDYMLNVQPTGYASPTASPGPVPAPAPVVSPTKH